MGIWDLAKLGFVWQFITLAGFHSDALSIDLFARDYAKRGMAAYVQLIQRQEWSGSEIVDEAGNIISGGTSSTGIMSAGVTEHSLARSIDETDSCWIQDMYAGGVC